MTTAIASKGTLKWYINSAITLLLMFGIGHLPPVGALTPVGMDILGIFIGVVYGWTTVELIWPSLVGFFALGFTDITTMQNLFIMGFGNDVWVFMLLMFIFMAFLEHAGVTNFLCNWIISRKFLKGRPWLFSLILLEGCYLIASFVGAFASIVFFWALIYSVCQKFGYKPYDKYPTLMLLGVMIASCYALVVFPFLGNAIILVASFQQMSSLSIDFLQFIAFTIPLGVLSVAVYVLICRYIFKPDMTALQGIDDSIINKDDLKLTTTTKIALALSVLMLFLMLAPKFMPADFFLTLFLNKMGMSGVFVILIVISLILRVDGQPFFRFKAMADKGVMWEALLLGAFIMPLSSLLTNEATGITAFLSGLFGPILAGRSPFVFMLIIIICANVLTNFANNGVIALIFMSIVCSFSDAMAINPTPICVMIMLTVQIALITPAASPFAAILFGNTAWLKPADIRQYGIISIALLLVVMVTVGYGWLHIIY